MLHKLKVKLIYILNGLGVAVMAFAGYYPNASADLVKLLPPALQPFAPLVSLVWGGLVLYSIRKAKADAVAKG